MAIKISDLIPQSEPIETGRGHFDVRGLTLPEVVTLMTQHRAKVLELVASSLSSGKPDWNTLLTQAPDLCFIVIALAADAVGQEDDIARLPGAVHLVALSKIWKLSVPDPKALGASLTVLASALQNAPQPAKKAHGHKDKTLVEVPPTEAEAP